MINRNDLIKRLPKYELSYDSILHRKVQGNLYQVIPKGNRCLLWITYVNDQNLPIILFLNKYNEITNIELFSLCFNDNLSLGTLFIGTLFTCQKSLYSYFTCENIIQYKGINVNKKNYFKKLEIIKYIFKNELKQKIFSRDSLIVGLPVMINTLEDLPLDLPYEYDYCKIYWQKKGYIKYLGMEKIHSNKFGIFKITATLKPDVYKLYTKDDKFHSYAAITNFSNSVKLNKLFRNIKENSNLDLLEQSDNEDEFENINADKYVNLNIFYNMKCKYIKKFNKWEPLSII